MMSTRPPCVLALATLLAAGARPASAALVRLKPTDLAVRADAVVAGTVTSVRSRFENRTIWTTVDIQVTQALKGSPGSTVSLRLPGGLVDRTTSPGYRGVPLMQVVSETPVFSARQDVLLFLRTRNGKPTIVGGAQGARMLQRDRLTNRLFLTQGRERLYLDEHPSIDNLIDGLRQGPAVPQRKRGQQ
jgi:hypothetical protein